MSDQVLPAEQNNPFGETQLQAWQEPRQVPPPPTRSPIERPVAAIRRYKWLILSIVVLSSVGGVIATRFLKPQYEVQARLILSSSSPMQDRTGPIRSSGLLEQDDWIQLLKSYVISDAVVRKLSLYVKPENASDSTLFKDFTIADFVVFGQYDALIDRGRKRWTLTHVQTGLVRDSGTVADSVGKAVGFRWTLPKWAFNGSGQKKIRFTVSTPREIAFALSKKLSANRPAEQSNFLLLSLQDPDPNLAARTVNTWLTEYVTVAAQLKNRKLVQFANTLAGQLQASKASLDSAEVSLAEYRVKTIVKPGENSPVSANTEQTRDPVINAFLAQQVEWGAVKHDVAALENILKTMSTQDSVPASVLLQVPTVAQGGAPAEALRQAFKDYEDAQTQLAGARVGFTDEHPIVKGLVAKVKDLKQNKIPELARQLLTTLRTKAADDSVRIAAQGKDLQEIPQRTIEEERYRRVRDVDAGLYTNLQNRFAEAQLAQASASPDVSILDSAIAPLDPVKNTMAIVILGAVFGGLGAAVGLAILLDKLDGRFRYPEQASEELGLPISGTVPRFPKGGADHRSPEQMFQLVESFRSLRMSVMHATGPNNMSLAISSPSPGEGKSLISANLAMSFADAGLRTVLVDGDTRRGTLHDMFGAPVSPGLTDYLSGQVTRDDVLRQTDHDKLSLITCGVRQRRSPELLTSPRLKRLVEELKATFDVVIFDTPPLAAGIDGYSIAAAAGSLLVVLRVGETERRMAAAKLRMFERLPVDVVGAVLNGIQFQGEYEYYGYVGGYEAEDESPGTAVAQVP